MSDPEDIGGAVTGRQIDEGRKAYDTYQRRQWQLAARSRWARRRQQRTNNQAACLLDTSCCTTTARRDHRIVDVPTPSPLSPPSLPADRTRSSVWIGGYTRGRQGAVSVGKSPMTTACLPFLFFFFLGVSLFRLHMDMQGDVGVRPGLFLLFFPSYHERAPPDSIPGSRRFSNSCIRLQAA